jgi:hypothetical protein
MPALQPQPHVRARAWARVCSSAREWAHRPTARGVRAGSVWAVGRCRRSRGAPRRTAEWREPVQTYSTPMLHVRSPAKPPAHREYSGAALPPARPPVCPLVCLFVGYVRPCSAPPDERRPPAPPDGSDSFHTASAVSCGAARRTVHFSCIACSVAANRCCACTPQRDALQPPSLRCHRRSLLLERTHDRMRAVKPRATVTWRARKIGGARARARPRGRLTWTSAVPFGGGTSTSCLRPSRSHCAPRVAASALHTPIASYASMPRLRERRRSDVCVHMRECRNGRGGFSLRWRSRRRCGRGGPSPGADMGGVGQVPAQMWAGWAKSRRRCGRGGPSPGADVGRGGPSLGADLGGGEPRQVRPTV